MKVNLKGLLAALPMIAPYVLKDVGLPPELAGFATHAITEGAKMKGASGAEKLAHAVSIFQDSVAGANAVDPGLIDAPLANHVVAGAISEAYDTAKLVAESKQHLKDQAAAAATAHANPTS